MYRKLVNFILLDLFLVIFFNHYKIWFDNNIKPILTYQDERFYFLMKSIITIYLHLSLEERSERVLTELRRMRRQRNVSPDRITASNRTRAKKKCISNINNIV